MSEAKASDKALQRKRAVKALLLGAILALACRALPHAYQVPCETLVKLCTGGL
jgi:hypothetical protein